MQNGDKSFTSNGNLRSPGYINAIKWISEIWDEIDTNLLAKSFDVCGITQNNSQFFHKQLYWYLEKGLKDMVVDEDGSEEIRGFGDTESSQSEDESSDVSESE